RPRQRAGGVVPGYAPADDHAGVGCDAGQTQVEYLAADVVEVDVDALRAEAAQFRADVLLLVVGGAVEAQFIGEPGAFLRGAGDSYHPAAVDACDLPGNAAGGAGGSADDDGFTGLRVAQIEQPEVCRHAGAAENAQ